MVQGRVKAKPLNAKAKKLLKEKAAEVRELSKQIRALRKQAHERECLIDWLESPWDYGDIVEEIPRRSIIREKTRPGRVFVVTEVGSLRCGGRLIKKDGTLGKDLFELFNEYKDEPIGRYKGSDLPKPPPGAEEAMRAKGTW
jgi:hypothetical protein